MRGASVQASPQPARPRRRDGGPRLFGSRRSNCSSNAPLPTQTQTELLERLLVCPDRFPERVAPLGCTPRSYAEGAGDDTHARDDETDTRAKSTRRPGGAARGGEHQQWPAPQLQRKTGHDRVCRGRRTAPRLQREFLRGAKLQRASRVPGANSLEIVMPCWTHPRRPPIAPGYTALLLPHLDRFFAHRRALLLGELLEGVVGRGRILSIIGQPLCEHEQNKGGPGNTRQHSRCMRRRSHFEQENCGILEPGS